MSHETAQEHCRLVESAFLTGRRRKCREQLAEAGQLLLADGQFTDGNVAVSIYTDRGPATADKDTNQDFVLAWRPSGACGPRQIQLIMTLADGVSSALYAEWAAELACWTSAHALLTNRDQIDAADLARFAFDSAGSAIGRLAEELAATPTLFKPQDEFDATWAYRLRRGRLVQTTLLLAWIDGEGLHVASVGDAGAVCHITDDANTVTSPADHVIAHCDLETSLVNAIGPHQTTIRQFDGWFEAAVGTQLLFAAYTDGIGRGLGTQPLVLLKSLETSTENGFEHPARCYTRRAIDERPNEHDDNVTLGVLLHKT